MVILKYFCVFSNSISLLILKILKVAMGICVCVFVCVYVNFNNLSLSVIDRTLHLLWVESLVAHSLQPPAKSFWLHSFQNLIKNIVYTITFASPNLECILSLQKLILSLM